MLSSKSDSLKSLAYPSTKNGLGADRRRNVRKEGDFDWKESKEWADLRQRYGEDIHLADVLDLARIVAERSALALDREARRRKSELIKWFHDHWKVVVPHFPATITPRTGLDLQHADVEDEEAS
jgi:hypothetical protein